MSSEWTEGAGAKAGGGRLVRRQLSRSRQEVRVAGLGIQIWSNVDARAVPLTRCGEGQVGDGGEGSDNSKPQGSGLRPWVDNETGNTALEWELGEHPELGFEHVQSAMPLRHPSGCLGLMFSEEERARDTLV